MDTKENSDPDFAQRVDQISKMVGGPSELARRSGLSRRVIDKYIAGGSDPSRQRLICLAKAANVSIQWLATGEQMEEATQPRTVNTEAEEALPSLDPWLFPRIIDGIRRAYQRVGGQISTIHEVELGIEIHNRIALLIPSREGRQGALTLALDQLERDLRSAGKIVSNGDKRTA